MYHALLIATSTPRQRESNNRLSAGPRCFPQFLHHGRFEIVRVGMHLSGDHFFFRGPDKAQLTMPQVTIRFQCWTKRAASHRARFVKFTGSGRGIEHWTRLGVAKIIPPLRRFVGVVFVQHPGNRVARIVLGKPCDSLERTLAETRGPLWLLRFKFRQSLAQPDRIQLIDGKYPVATLRAPGLARQPLAAFLHGISQRRIHDLNQFLISGRGEVARHLDSLFLDTLFKDKSS